MSQITIVGSNLQERWIELSINDKAERHFLLKPPEVNSYLVQASRYDILQKLSIDALILDLSNAADLMFLAYNALAGTQIQSKVFRLQKSLLDISGDCMNTLDIFGIQSQEVTRSLIKIYQRLLEGKDKLALIEVKYCGEIAGEMANAAQELAKRFENLSRESQGVNQDAINLVNLNDKEKSDQAEKLRDFKAKEQAAKVLRDELEKQMINLTREYHQSVEKLKDGWFKSAVKAVVGICGVRDPNETALREVHESYNQASQALNRQKLENFNDLQRYALEIAKAETNIANAAKAVETFHYAVRAISIIVTTLTDATLFWRSIERYCKQLEQSKLSNQIQALQGELSAAEMIEEYTSKSFMALFVTSLSQWVALDSVCREYLMAAKNTYNKVSSNIASSPSIATAKAQTPSLAQRIFNSIEQEKKALKEREQKNQRWGDFLTILDTKSQNQRG